MRITILNLTRHPVPMLEGLPTVGQQIETWIAPSLPEAKITITPVAEGARLPDAETFDGLILSGSEFGVYDDVPWMEPLRAALIGWRDLSKPIFGICFGHQIMADAFGGRAEKVDAGMVVGPRPFVMEGQAVAANVWHQDQVTKVPPGAEVIGHAAHCPVGALRYGFPALSVQFHPEHTHDLLRDIFERGRGTIIEPVVADAAEATFETTSVDVDLMAAEAAAFFRRHLPAATSAS